MATKNKPSVHDILQCRRAEVLLDGIPAGILEQVATDHYSFTYASQYLEMSHPPLSWSMPLAQKKFESDTLLPFFDNLLFEGRQLRAAEKAYGLSRQSVSDRFKLLLLFGQDTIGGVSIAPINAQGEYLAYTPHADIDTLATWKPVPLQPGYADFCPICLNPSKPHPHCTTKLWGAKKHLNVLTDPDDHNAVFHYTVPGASISGAQIKNILRLTRDGTLKPGLPFTHILKPHGDFAEMPANEHLTMCIARSVGFEVPPCGLYRVDDVGLIFIVKRFDWDNKQRRYLMEDFAQVLGMMENEKEHSTMEDVARALQKSATSSLKESRELFRRILFNFMIGNGDMHLKNWALVFDKHKSIYRLSPIYDWLNVRASMPQEKVESVLPINQKRDQLHRGDFVTFAKNIGLNDKIINQSLSETLVWDKIVAELVPRSALSDKLQTSYRKIVSDRLRRLKG